MPEAGESAPKTSDFFLGVVDFFAIILPGCLLVYWAQRALNLGGYVSPEWTAGTRGWAVFLVAAYVAGHIAFALGGLLFDKVYDQTYKLAPAENRKDYCLVRIRAKDLTKALLTKYYVDGDNALEWAATFVRLGSSAASAEIDRLEADSKFFRSLAVVLVLIWSFNPLSLTPHAHWAWVSLITSVPVVALRIGLWLAGSISGSLEAQKKDISKELLKTKHLKELDFELEAEAEAQANEEVSKWRRRWSWCALAAWVLLVAGPPIWWFRLCPKALVGAASAALGVFSVWRYMERRLKRTELTYRYLIALPNAARFLERGHAGSESAH
jgi:hypothetical protein